MTKNYVQRKWMAERMRCGVYVWESTLRGTVFENTSNDYCAYTVTARKNGISFRALPSGPCSKKPHQTAAEK
jgi:hypothetical protein